MYKLHRLYNQKLRRVRTSCTRPNVGGIIQNVSTRRGEAVPMWSTTPPEYGLAVKRQSPDGGGWQFHRVFRGLIYLNRARLSTQMWAVLSLDGFAP